MCPYENTVGCFKCPFPDCMLNGADKLPRKLQMEFRRSHHAVGSKEKEREYNLKYKAEHREEINAREREKRRKMKAALEYCERMGIEV